VRIALLSDTYIPQVNGVTTVVRRIVALLRAHGHETAVVAPRYPGFETPEQARELRIPSLPFPPYPAIRLSVPSAGRVHRFLDAFGPDLIHVHTEGPLGLAGRRYTQRRGVPLVTSFHTHFPDYSRDYGLGALEPAIWRWLRWFHGPARLTLTPGAAVRAELVDRGLASVAVWGRGVDTALFHPAKRQPGWRRWLAGGDDTAIVLHVGRLAPEKNLDVLIEAWRLAYEMLGQRATFVVAGEGPVGERIQSRLPFARLLGFLPREHLATLYASADLCVFPSRTETCGLVALEALSSGVAVVAADAGGFRESIVSSQTGVLVGPQDPRAFADAIVELVTDPGRRFGLAAAGREYALTRDVSREDIELLELYAALTGKPSHGVQPCAA
jgi:glycosyltransferase involved in cell wall biosynthesis